MSEEIDQLLRRWRLLQQWNNSCSALLDALQHEPPQTAADDLQQWTSNFMEVLVRTSLLYCDSSLIHPQAQAVLAMQELQNIQSAVVFPETLAPAITRVRGLWMQHASQCHNSQNQLATPPAASSSRLSPEEGATTTDSVVGPGSSAATGNDSASIQSTTLEDEERASPRDLTLRLALQAQLNDLRAQRAVLVRKKDEAFNRFQNLCLIEVKLAGERA